MVTGQARPDVIQTARMSSPENAFRKRILLICAGGGAVLLALALAQAKGMLTTQVFTVLAILWWLAMIAVLLPSIRGFNREMAARRQARMAQGLPAESPEALARRIRNLRRSIALMVILFPLLLWANSDETRTSEAVGAAVWLLLIGALVRALLRRQKAFKALQAAAKAEEPRS